jgi:hypothetical protein
MRTFLFSTAMIAGVVCTGVAPARAAPQPVLGFTATKVDVASVEDVGYRRRYYRRYGYPYAYYPPAYGYYPPVCTENLNPDVVVMKSAKDRV